MHYFKNLGYRVHIATMLGEIFNKDTPLPLCDEYFKLPINELGMSLENSVTSAVLARSMLEPIRYLLPVDDHYYNRMVEGIFNWIEKSVNENRPRFYWAHIICPHAPYLFNSDGSWRREAGNETDPQNYLAQYKYVTMRIMEVLETLVENDPDCVILLMSDHSVRQRYTLPVDDMARIFLAVYFRGEMLDVDKLSGLDAEWLILNRLFDAEFPVVRDLRPLSGAVP